jgi:hypothetical protein
MSSSPLLVPAINEDRDVYLVLDDFGALGRAWRETGELESARDEVLRDLIDGQYSNPAKVVAFNTLQGWSRDVSREFADLIARRCGADGFDVPPFLEAFVELHGTHRPAELPLSPSRRRLTG